MTLCTARGNIGVGIIKKRSVFMEKLKTPKQINSLALLLAVTYMISYITRINFGGVVSEMATATGFTKSMLSMSLTGSFITYGTGQILCGIMGDRISPKKMITIGLVMTICMNCLIPLCQNPWQMLGVWCVNGFAQAFMWPPIVRMMTALLEADDYKRTVAKVSWGSSVGTILIYLISPVVIMTVGWKGVFFGAAALGALMLILWNWKAVDIQPTGSKKVAAPKGSNKILFTPVVLCIMIPIVLQGMLRDGITTWMPTFIAESFHLGNEISILTGVLLPVFSIGCFQFTTWLYRKKIQNPLAASALLFGVGGVAALALFFLSQESAAASVVLSATLTGAMHGVNLLLICMVPQCFEKYGNISTVSGVLNACTYIGSALSTYGIAALSEIIGWQNTIFVWFCITVAGALLCLLCVKPWKKKFMND